MKRQPNAGQSAANRETREKPKNNQTPSFPQRTGTLSTLTPTLTFSGNVAAAYIQFSNHLESTFSLGDPCPNFSVCAFSSAVSTTPSPACTPVKPSKPAGALGDLRSQAGRSCHYFCQARLSIFRPIFHPASLGYISMPSQYVECRARFCTNIFPPIPIIYPIFLTHPHPISMSKLPIFPNLQFPRSSNPLFHSQSHPYPLPISIPSIPYPRNPSRQFCLGITWLFAPAI